jgi:plastocyanin
MSDATIFYIFGGLLAAMAVATSLIGLRVESFPGRYGPAIFLCFVAVVGTAVTFAILNGKSEERAHAAEYKAAGERVEAIEGEAPRTEGAGAATESKPEAKAKGPGGTLQLAASPTALAFDKTSLSSKPGKVTIDFENPAALEHDVAIEGPEGKEITVSPKITEGKTSVSADLAPGTYHFFCTVPGHREAGMEGTLTVR